MRPSLSLLVVATLTACVQERVEVNIELDPLTQLVKRCEEGDGQACFDLGKHFSEKPEDGGDGAALRAYKEGCELEHGPSCTNAGFSLEQESDAIAVLTYYRKGCDLEHAQGCVNLGSILLQGPGEVDGMAAFRAFERACDKNHAVACNNAGKMLSTGEGINKDLTKARPFAEKACKLEQRLCSELALGTRVGWFGEPDHE